MLVSQAAAYRHHAENRLGERPLALLTRRMEEQTSISKDESCDKGQRDL